MTHECQQPTKFDVLCVGLMRNPTRTPYHTQLSGRKHSAAGNSNTIEQ